MSRILILGVIGAMLLAGCAPAIQNQVTQAPIQTSPLPPSDTPGAAPTDPGSAPETEAPPLETATPEPPASLIAYEGKDGNLWLAMPDSGELRQLTQDATPPVGSQDLEQTIRYCCVEWSSDGQYLAYQREVGTAIASGFDFQNSLWVYDLAGDQHLPMIENQWLAGFAWRPGAHIIAYGRMIDPQFFITQSADLALGIWAVDVESREKYELVPPEGGRPLVSPQWSPEGRFLGFDEVLYMEGRGQFAYYDFESQTYTSWEEIIGFYDWAPGGEQIAYDLMAYTPTGEERIYLRDRQGGEAQPFSPELERGYTFLPVFSPTGDRLAYLAANGGPDDNTYMLFVAPIGGGEPRPLGEFEQVQNLAWAPDGETLVFSAGPYEGQQVVIVSLADGEVTPLAEGGRPAWQPMQ